MSPDVYQFVQIDLAPLLTGTFAAVACGILGNFLVLRRMSLMGDAISHAVLPGLVVAFLLTSSRATLPMFLGAAFFGILTAFLVELIRKLGRLESGAAMGVVFSVLFALGVLLLEQAAARTVDLDADCVLHGQLEHIFWFPPETWAELISWQTIKIIPHELLMVTSVAFIAAGFIAMFYKELKITSFDPELATSLGIRAGWMHYALMIMVAAAVVASFSAVGSILVIAMLICPAATARLFTDRLPVQIGLSVIFALLTGVLGYLLGAFGPLWVGWENSVSVSGMMTVVAGIFLFGAVVFSPSYGLIAKVLRQVRIEGQILCEDLLGFLYRVEELTSKESERQIPLSRIRQALGGGMGGRVALYRAKQQGWVKPDANSLCLTPTGRNEARLLVRTHRLWESFLYKELGLQPDHVHPPAEWLEHFTSDQMKEELSAQQRVGAKDPHGKPIPQEKNGKVD